MVSPPVVALERPLDAGDDDEEDPVRWASFMREAKPSQDELFAFIGLGGQGLVAATVAWPASALGRVDEVD